MNQGLKIVRKEWAGANLERLSEMRTDEIYQLHRALFGSDVASGNSEQARRRIAWRIQAEREGGLPESARQHALSIARESGTRLRSRFAKHVTAPLSHGSVTAIVSDDLRRTCAKLCQAAGGDLEQIQMLLGHASVQTTEQYLGTKQDLVNAPNDRIM